MSAHQTETEAVLDPKAAARAARLRYVSDERPGIRREPDGDGFRYIAPDGREITDEGELKRIRSLAIPPAYTDVWICPYPNGHLQATGRDARGRKQYRYHPRWHEVRDEAKYHRVIAFGQALPRIRERAEQDLRRPGLPREKVLAAVVRLLETTLIRVGNEEYVRSNKSFGLTTMRDRHVEVGKSELRFKFRGKGGKFHRITLRDRRLARVVKRSRDLPGQTLFQYVDEDGEQRTIDSGDVNDYLREIAGEEFTAKDFRTWAGTVLAARALREIGAGGSQTEAKKNVVRAIEAVAELLGNTPSICRKCYVHPTVLEAYLDGGLVETLGQRAAEALDNGGASLSAEEREVLEFLQRRLGDEGH